METPNPSAMEVNLETDQQVQSKDKPQRTELKRGLSARHMQMIAIGGAIGTGLFVASGATISTAGPGGALAAYAVIGLMVLLLMQSLGEMSAHMPVAGSFQTYATRFVSPHSVLQWAGTTGSTGRLPSQLSLWHLDWSCRTGCLMFPRGFGQFPSLSY